MHHLLRALHRGRTLCLFAFFLFYRRQGGARGAMAGGGSAVVFLWATSCTLFLGRRSPWAVHIASATTASGSGARGGMSAPSADSPSSPRPAAWPSTTASTAWWRTWPQTWRPGGGSSPPRGKVRGASAVSSLLRTFLLVRGCCHNLVRSYNWGCND